MKYLSILFLLPTLLHADFELPQPAHEINLKIYQTLDERMYIIIDDNIYEIILNIQKNL